MACLLTIPWPSAAAAWLLRWPSTHQHAGPSLHQSLPAATQQLQTRRAVQILSWRLPMQVNIPMWALVHLPVVVTFTTAMFTPRGWLHCILYVLFENAMGIVKLGAVVAGAHPLLDLLCRLPACCTQPRMLGWGCMSDWACAPAAAADLLAMPGSAWQSVQGLQPAVLGLACLLGRACTAGRTAMYVLPSMVCHAGGCQCCWQCWKQHDLHIALPLKLVRPTKCFSILWQS